MRISLTLRLYTKYYMIHNDMTLNRTLSPDFKTIKNVPIPPIQNLILANGTPLHVVNVGEQPVVRLEISFEAGAWYDTEQGTSLFTSKMLNEGTSKHSSNYISEFFDQYGSFVEFGHGLDRANFTLYGLTKHLGALLPLIKEILTDSVFPEKELETLKKIQEQSLKVNQEKTAYVAGQELRKNIFGESHPYANKLTQASISNISREGVLNFYESFWKGKKYRIFLSGQVGDTEIALIESFFGQDKLEAVPQKLVSAPAPNYGQAPIFIEKEGALQTSVRMGKVLMQRANPDYFKMLVVNEIFGGYFGSRLMKNIREDKGYTYGISSNLVSSTHGGYFILGTDTKREFTEQTIQEIHHELVRLQTEPVGNEELQVVKNYMIGSFAGSLTTPFEISDRYKVILSENLPLDYYNNYVERINSVSTTDILEMASKYLSIDSMTTVLVGGK